MSRISAKVIFCGRSGMAHDSASRGRGEVPRAIRLKSVRAHGELRPRVTQRFSIGSQRAQVLAQPSLFAELPRFSETMRRKCQGRSAIHTKGEGFGYLRAHRHTFTFSPISTIADRIGQRDRQRLALSTTPAVRASCFSAGGGSGKSHILQQGQRSNERFYGEDGGAGQCRTQRPCCLAR